MSTGTEGPPIGNLALAGDTVGATLAQPATVELETIAPAIRMFEEIGVPSDIAQRMLSIQMNAGGVCLGTLGEFIAIPEHEVVATKFVNRIVKAQEKGEDLLEVAYDKFDMFTHADDEGNIMHATVVQRDENPDSKKK